MTLTSCDFQNGSPLSLPDLEKSRHVGAAGTLIEKVKQLAMYESLCSLESRGRIGDKQLLRLFSREIE